MLLCLSVRAGGAETTEVSPQLLAITGNEYSAAWQQKRPGGWWERVHAVEPALADVVAPGTDGDRVLTIVRLLRNSVHGAALEGVAFVQGSGPQETLVGLPHADQAEVLGAMDALGGRARWGAKEILTGRTHIDPGVLVEQLFQTVPPVLNHLLDRTPVERLSAVDLLPQQLTAPTGTTESDPFDDWIRQSISLQLGLA